MTEDVKAAKPKKEKVVKVKVERERKNGFTRPKPGSRTVLVWDIADAISAEHGRPALRGEVLDAFVKQNPNGSLGMAGTQYSRWCTFNGAGPALKSFRNEQKMAKAAKTIKAYAAAEATPDSENEESAAEEDTTAVAKPAKKATVSRGVVKRGAKKGA